MSLLKEFSNQHRADILSDFRNHWNVWLQKYDSLIKREKSRLEGEGYRGDVYDKMYKSIRYYLKNKSDEKKSPKKRRKYHAFNRTLLEDMDRHISKVAFIENLKPAHAYNNFYGSSQYNKEIETERAHLIVAGLKEGEIEDKIKKTYKNRYFILQHK